MGGQVETFWREEPCGCLIERTEELDEASRHVLISETMTYCDRHRAANWTVKYSKRDAKEGE